MNWIIVSGLLIALVAALLETGYRYGVRETERRWSEAVARAEAQREEGKR